MKGPVLPASKKGDIVSLLSNLKKESGGSLINSVQASNLVNLKFKNGENILTFEHIYFVYEIAWLLQEKGYDIVFNFLSTNWENVFGEFNLRKKILFENPLLDKAKDKFYSDMDIFKTRVEVSEGEKCPRCQSKETIVVSAQSRRCDESESQYASCTICTYKWRLQ